jgi:hypothetical protein
MRAFLTCLGLYLFLFSFDVPAARASSTAGPYSLELIDENGNTLPTFWKGGRTYVLGEQGARYSLRIRNQSGTRVEFVASVDGRDVLDGRPAGMAKRGYIVAPWGEVSIDGFRLNQDSVAAFRFSSVRDSYAAQMGDARDVGVIGVAVFPEQQVQRRFVPPSGLFGAGDPGSGLNNALGGLGSRGDARGAADLDAQPPSAAPAAAGARALGSFAKKAERPGLGTEFGEQRSSRVEEVAFQRASSQPAATLTVRYNDRQGLRAMGVNINPIVGPREAELRETANPFPNNYCAPPPGWGR